MRGGRLQTAPDEFSLRSRVPDTPKSDLLGKADTPDDAPDLMRMLGSRFVAHPDVKVFEVKVSDPNHPIVAGLGDFEIEDEPYYCEHFGDNHALLEASYNNLSHGYVQSEFGTDQDSHPPMYLHPYGKGEVLYLTLGHCRGKYDLRPLMNIAPVERCAWNYPVFYDLLRRGIAWGVNQT